MEAQVQVQFADRTLKCSDCHADFIFTAGEQLFFHDKQFRNDPKRCKPCKSRRSGLATAANGASHHATGLARTETRTECSECGIETTVPFKPTQGRPVLCRQCFQLKARAAAAGPVMTQAEAVSTLIEASENSEGAILSPEAAVLAAASMAAAQPGSGVATAADLASLTEILDTTPETAKDRSRIPAELLADVLSGHIKSPQA